VGGESSDEGPHLHFEIRGQGGIALDPANWLRRPPPPTPAAARPRR
jgi:murein DD-endopeptidase MepM/ murein hydrolase activator NlpD